MGGLDFGIGDSSTLDFIRKNEPRGDKLTIDDYGIVYDTLKEIPRIKSQNGDENQEITFIVTNNQVWIIKGIEVIIQLDSEPFSITGTNAKISIFYPDTESVSSPTLKTIVIDLENQGIDGILRLCEMVGYRKPTIIDNTNETGKKYISAFLNLNNIILDSNLNGNEQKQIKLKTENITPNSGINGIIYFKPIGWKILRTDW